MTFDANDRAFLAALADVLIPPGHGFPSASQAGVTAVGLDQVLIFRPDFAAGLKSLLASACGRAPEEFIAEIQQNDPASFGLLAELVPGAYFLNPNVRAQLRYQGQTPRAIDPGSDHLDEGLLQSVIERGPIYRPTPP